MNEVDAAPVAVTNRFQPILLATGVCLLALYALPMFVPPSGTIPTAPAADATLWERVFPGVPTGWVVGRLICLLFGACLVAAARRGVPSIVLRDPPSGGLSFAPGRTRLWCALAFALAQTTLGFFAARFDRTAEALYFVAWGVVPLLLLSGEIGSWRKLLAGAISRVGWLGLIPLAWAIVSAPIAWRSPRAATIVDMWVMLQRLGEVVAGSRHMLSDSATPGHTNAYMMLEGISFMGENGFPITYVGLQAVHLFWGMMCGFGVGLVTWRMVGRRAAFVAQAVFLFSQYGMAAPYSPGPTLIAPLCMVALMILWLSVRETGSATALAAFGVAAGFSSTEPTVVLVALVLCALVAYSTLRLRPLPWLALIVAIACALAVIIPGIPDWQTVVDMKNKYTFGRRQLAGILMILFGQKSPQGIFDTLVSGRPGEFDLPIGASLSPFASARMPLRLAGDALLEPIGAVLAAIGLLLMLRVWRRRGAARLVVVLMLLGLVQGFVSAGDAISHGRMAAAFIPLAIMAGLAAEYLLPDDPRWRVRSTASLVGLVALSGTVLFTVVNRSFLISSSMTITFEALGADNSGRDVVVFKYGPRWVVSWLCIDEMANLLPRSPLAVWRLLDLYREENQPIDGAQRLYFWGPGLEEEEGASYTVCDRLPAAALYEIVDRPGLLSTHAASPSGANWQPAISRDRWAVRFCDGPMSRDPDTYIEEPLSRLSPWLVRPKVSALPAWPGL